MAFKSNSRIQVLCWLLVVLSEVQTTCPMIMFPAVGFVSTTEIGDKGNIIVADRFWNSMKETIEQNVNKMVSVYRENLCLLQEKIQKYCKVGSTDSQVVSDRNFGAKYSVLYHLVLTVIIGADMALFGTTLRHFYLRDFRLVNIGIFLMTSYFPYSFHEEIINAEAGLRTSFETLSDTIWGMLPFGKEEEIFIIQTPEDTTIQKVLKKFLPGIDLTSPTFKLTKCLLLISEKAGISLSNFFTAVILTIATNELFFVMYEYYHEDIEQKTFTDEEFLEDYKDDEELYYTIEEWLTPTKIKNSFSELNDFNGLEFQLPETFEGD